MEAEEAARWESAIGRNARHYLKAFERIRARGRWVPGWNSAAFLHSSAWFLYRRMYGLALLNFLGPLALVIFFAAVGIDAALPFVVGAYLLGAFVLLPILADGIYFAHLQGRLDRAKPPSLWTGIAAGLLVAFTGLFLFLMLKASYGDYTPRAKVSEAILVASAMRAGVTEFHADQGRFPTAAEASGYANVGSRYVASVAWDDSRNVIVVTMREPHPGKRLEITAIVQGKKLVEWRCGSPDIDKKDLPASCRGEP